LARSRFEVIVSRHVEAGVAQAGAHVLSTSQNRPSRETQKHLAGIAPSRLPRLARKFEQSDLSEDGHFDQQLPKPPCSFATSLMKDALGATDMIFAPLRTMRVSFIRSPELVGLQRQPARLEFEKRCFETIPLRLDDAQAKPGAKSPPGHLRQHAVVAEFGKRLRIRRGRSSLFSAFAPPCASRAGADRLNGTVICRARFCQQ